MLTQNLKYLRKKHRISQEALAAAIGVSKTTLGDYERGKYEPSIATLIHLAQYFNVSLDDLLLKDLKHEDYEIIRNKDLRVLAITMDNEGKENIELVDTKAEAGYIESFNDPEYLRELPKLYFPNIPEGTYRAFEIRGDSMLPVQEGDIVICKYVEDIKHIKNGNTYVIVSKAGGLAYKRVQVAKDKNALLMTSDNPVYPPYLLEMEDIAEIWQFYAYLSREDPKNTVEWMTDSRISDIHAKVNGIYRKVIS